MNNKIQQTQESFLKAILDFYKDNPNEYFTAKDITEKFDLISGHNNWFVHYALKELQSRGKLAQKKRSGFKYKRKKS